MSVAEPLNHVALDVPAASESESSSLTACETDVETPVKPRMNYVDWLRTYLTLLVIVYHVNILVMDNSNMTLDNGTNVYKWFNLEYHGSYFMAAFFLLAGYFSTPSYNKKGAMAYLKDRFLRLMIPTIVYELCVIPLMSYWDDPKGSLGTFMQIWFQKYKPPKSHLWFTLLLFLFDLVYVLARVCIPALNRKLSQKQTKSQKMFTNRYALFWSLGISLFLILITFLLRWPFRMNFRVAIIAQVNVIGLYFFSYCFASVVYLSNALNRIPTRFGLLCHLPALASFLTFFVFSQANPKLYTPLRGGLNSLQLFFTSFQTLFVVFNILALIVTFRQFVNMKPNKFGKKIIGAAYTAYIIQYIVIQTFVFALAGWTPHVLIKIILVLMPLSLICCWALSIAIKLIPGINCIL